MNYEDLLSEANKNGIDVDESFPFNGRTKGLYIDGNIALSNSLETTTEKTCILAEELGHHYTTSGNILDMEITGNRKQERKARIWSYNKLIGLMGLVNSYKAGCQTMHDMAEYLDVTEEFLAESINYYKSKYDVCATIDNYIVYFEPTLGVLELTNY